MRCVRYFILQRERNIDVFERVGAQMVKESYFIVVGKSKGGPGSAETPDN